MNFHARFTKHCYWPLAQSLKKEYALHAQRELSDSQWKSQDELVSQQWQLVRRVVAKAAKAVPYYRKSFKKIGWDYNYKNFFYD